MKALIIHSKNFCIKMKTNILLMQVWAASAPGEVSGMPVSNDTGRELGQFLKNRFIDINSRFLPLLQRQNYI